MLVAACIGAALVVACVAFFKTSGRVSRSDDERIWGPIATPYEDHVSAAGPIATVPTAASASVRRAETPRPAPAPLRLPGYLSVNSRPWAELSVDGQVVGNTPQVRVRVIPGRHHLLLARPGFLAHSAWVEVPAGATVRLTNITLAEITQ
jgi:PEGA domain-containing protein